MTLKISKMLHTLSKNGGIQQSNKFRVRVPSLRMGIVDRALGYDKADPYDLNILCSSATIPGINYETATRQHGTFSAQQTVTGYEVDNATFTFIETSNGIVRTWIEHWMDSIIDEYGRVAFVNDISQDMFVETLDREGNVTMVTRLLACYPLTRPQYTVSNDNDKPIEITVQFFVKDYEIVTGTEQKISNKIRDAKRVINVANQIFK